MFQQNFHYDFIRTQYFWLWGINYYEINRWYLIHFTSHAYKHKNTHTNKHKYQYTHTHKFMTFRFLFLFLFLCHQYRFFFFYWKIRHFANEFSLIRNIFSLFFSVFLVFFTMEIYHDQHYTFVIQYYSISQWMTLGPNSYIWLKSYNILLLDISTSVVNVTKSQFNLQSAGIANYFYFTFFYFILLFLVFFFFINTNNKNKKNYSKHKKHCLNWFQIIWKSSCVWFFIWLIFFYSPLRTWFESANNKINGK